MHINFGAVTPVKFNPRYTPQDRRAILRRASDLPAVLQYSGGACDLLTVPRYVTEVDTIEEMKARSPRKEEEWCDIVITDQDNRDFQTWIRKNRSRLVGKPNDEINFAFYHEFVKPRLSKTTVEIKKFKPIPSSGAFCVF